MVSDQVSGAAERLDCTHIVSVHRDEILILPGDLSNMVEVIFISPLKMYWNAIAPLKSRTNSLTLLSLNALFLIPEKYYISLEILPISTKTGLLILFGRFSLFWVIAGKACLPSVN